jgi:flagellin
MLHRRFIFPFWLVRTIDSSARSKGIGAASVSHQKSMKMPDLVLSASVRENLLSLQSTADLLATTQSRLATGKNVNTALDNPTNFFTTRSLDNRASDINNLLDGIGNGVQILQAANTGITSLQKLVDTAKSIANQVLQRPTGYSIRANVDVTGSGTGTGSTTAADLNAGKLGGSVLTFKTATGSLAVTIGSTFSMPRARCARKPRRWVRNCRWCRFVRTSPRA